MRSMLVAAGFLCFSVAQAVSAEQVTMVCENPRQEYLVAFNRADRTLVLNPDTDKTAYAVQAVAGALVFGDVGHDSGLSFVASFTKPLAMTLFSNAEIVQTDKCQAPTADLGL